jgi:hypothetical protein
MRQRSFITVILFTALASAVVLPAQVTSKFRAEHERLRTAARAFAVKKGLSEGELLRNALASPFKRPTAPPQKVLPGGSVSVTVTGDFPAGTQFLSERDAVTISGAMQTATSYSAKLTIPPDDAPGYVRLFAITPVGIEGFAAVAVVDTLYRFDLKSPDGYTITITPIDKTFTVDTIRASAKYQAAFYKPGQTTPFQTVNGDQSFDSSNAPIVTSWPNGELDISFNQFAGSPEAQMEELSRKLSDPKMPADERNAAMARMIELQKTMLDQMTKAAQTDPASLNKAQEDFGCGIAQLHPDKGVIVDGTILCGDTFHGGNPLKVTGTMTRIR